MPLIDVSFGIPQVAVFEQRTATADDCVGISELITAHS